MPRRLTNDLLLALVLAEVLSGVVGWALPSALANAVYPVHRVLGVATAVVLGWKVAIAAGSLRWRVVHRGRRWDRSVLWGSVAGLGLLLTVGLGLAWTSGLVSFETLWGYSALNVHVISGLALTPFVLPHLLLRRRANLAHRGDRSRRSVILGALGWGAATLLGWGTLESITGGIRRGSGSKAAASFSGNAFPAEIWLFDGVPELDAARWRLNVLGRELSLEDLAAQCAVRTVEAVLDCTGGWWSAQLWTGYALSDVLRMASEGDPPSGVAIVSVTGHRIVLPASEVGGALLATAVGGEPLSAVHGAPARLVVPDRRGYHWVKWVAAVTWG